MPCCANCAFSELMDDGSVYYALFDAHVSGYGCCDNHEEDYG